MTMEYVDGITLEEFIQRHKETGQQIPVDLAAFIISRICRGLAYAHKKTDRKNRPLMIVHRDVNPRNIMLAREGDVKLTDFGIAKAFELMYNNEGDVIAGKDGYLSPEQARCEITDGRADLFSCAIVLSELLLCDNIFEASSGEATRENILNMKIPNFIELRREIGTDLDPILQRGLQRGRDQRYQSASQMLSALEQYLYRDGYGPTNEKLALYMADLFSPDGAGAADRWAKRETSGLNHI